MAIKFTPSINIKRDIRADFEYISTPNSEKVISQLDYDFSKGIHSFTLLGSFGTGKSSFLLAFEKEIKNGCKQFKTKLKSFRKKDYDFINIVSQYCSLQDNFKDELNLKGNKNFLGEVDKKYKKLEKQKKGLIIVIDEFGKILEFASQNNPEKELYDLQLLAEFVNDSSKNILLIISLHQAFNDYANNLSAKQRDEWTKIKGRLKEIVFNEPVEQLLYLASERIKNGKEKIKSLNPLLKAINDAHVFPLRTLDKKAAQKLYPLDILAAAVLTLSLQRYGQNERSLFTFLNSNEFLELNNNGIKESYFSLVEVYKYLKQNFHYHLSTRYNVDFLHWQTINRTLQRAESLFEEDYSVYEKIIIIIGLLSIFGRKGANVNKDFIKQYLYITEGVKDSTKYITKLEQYKLIRYLKFKNAFILFEGTDLDLEYELQKAEGSISDSSNIVDALKKYFDLPPILAKANYYKYGIPRYFEFLLSEAPTEKIPTSEIDGFVNVIINENLLKKDAIKFSKNCSEAIIFGVIQYSEKLKEQIKEIDKINYLIAQIAKEDRVAFKELNNLKEYHISEINKYLSENLFTDNEFVHWYYSGEQIQFNSVRDFNKFLSKICDDKYNSVPIFRNELINREKLPGNISTARRVLLNKIISDWDKEDLGFPLDKYPPEKTIYLSLLKNTGIHKSSKAGATFGEPTDISFRKLWDTCIQFEENSKVSKKSIQDMIELLSTKPFKLKRGFVDCWLSVWLYIRRNDYALFNKNVFIPEITVDTIDLILKKPYDYFIKAFDLGGIRLRMFNKYRELINQGHTNKINKSNFIETIKPFLALYRELTHYSKNTMRLPEKAIKLREAIKNSKDPEQTFFEDFPNALGYTSAELNKSTRRLELFIADLMNAIRELSDSYKNLNDRIEDALIDEFGISNRSFSEYKGKIQKRYENIKKYILLPHQKTIYQRLNSKIDDRNSWLNSFIHSLIDKRIEKISDNEELTIYEKIKLFKLEFDNLCEFANLNIDNQKEEALKIEIAQIKEKPFSRIVTISKKWNGKTKTIEESVKNQLEKSKNKDQKIYILSKLLKAELDDK